MDNSKILRTIAQKLFPFVLMFGFYLTLHGHISPGGGFQGGVIIGTAIILLSLSYGINNTENMFREKHLSILEKLAILTFIFLGLIGIFFGYPFLKDIMPLGNPGCLASAGMMVPLNLVISIKVAAGITGIFYALIKYRGEI